jgi:hypothetical protein
MSVSLGNSTDVLLQQKALATDYQCGVLAHIPSAIAETSALLGVAPLTETIDGRQNILHYPLLL